MEISDRGKYLAGGATVFLFLTVLLAASAVTFSEGSVLGSDQDVTIEKNFTQGDTVTKPLSVSTDLQPDTDHSDGSIRYLYGKTTVVKDGQTVSESDWKQLDSQSFSKEFSQTFSDSGEYGYVLVLAKAESSYDAATGSWSEYDITRLDDSSYFFRVKAAPEPPSPDSSLQAFFDDLLGGLLSLVGL